MVTCHDSFNYPPKLIAGLDAAYQEDIAFSAVAVLDYDTFELVEAQIARSVVNVPYIPCFFGFREVKPLIKVISKLKKKADIYIVNAHGVAHPERCGCASHLGVALDIPTIGVANSAICGILTESEKGKVRYLRDKGDVVGAALYTKPAASPVYVSIGHRVCLESAINIVMRSNRENRMPEPLRVAHRLCSNGRKEYSRSVSSFSRLGWSS